MATFETTLFASQKSNRANTSRLPSANVGSGQPEWAVFSHTLTGSEAADDILRLCILPAGCIPLPLLSKVYSADPGTTLTLDVGTADNPDGFADGIVLSAGGTIGFESGTAPAWLVQTPLVADVDTTASGSGNAVVYATVASAASLTASTVLHFAIAYKSAR